MFVKPVVCEFSVVSQDGRLMTIFKKNKTNKNIFLEPSVFIRSGNQQTYFVITFKASLFILTSFLCLSFFSYLLSDCQDHLYKQLEKNRLLTNELRVALNEA